MKKILKKKGGNFVIIVGTNTRFVRDVTEWLSLNKIAATVSPSGKSKGNASVKCVVSSCADYDKLVAHLNGSLGDKSLRFVTAVYAGGASRSRSRLPRIILGPAALQQQKLIQGGLVPVSFTPAVRAAKEAQIARG